MYLNLGDKSGPHPLNVSLQMEQNFCPSLSSRVRIFSRRGFFLLLVTVGSFPATSEAAQVTVTASENVIGRAVRLSRARADRDFTGSVSPGPRDQDLTSIPGRVRSEAFKMSVGSV